MVNQNIKKFTVVSLFTAFAIILSYIEFLIPFNIGIQGFKLGLSNIATVYCLYMLGEKECVIITLIRILVINLLFGTIFSLMFSISGGIISCITMILLKRLMKSGIIFTSAIGGVVHNIAQIIIAFFIIESSVIFGLMPVLTIVGMITGLVVGIVSEQIYKRTYQYIKTMFRKENIQW